MTATVSASDYERLQDQHIALQRQVISAQQALLSFFDQAAKCHFVDDHGHPLEMNARFIALRTALSEGEKHGST